MHLSVVSSDDLRWFSGQASERTKRMPMELYNDYCNYVNLIGGSATN